MVIVENSLVKVEYDSSIETIIWTPLGFMQGEEWRMPFKKGIEFLEDKIVDVPKLRWLNDTRLLKTVSLVDLKWLNEKVNDPCYKAGLKKVAFVLPQNVFGKMAVKFYVEFTNKRSDNQFQIKAFKEYDDAVKWLTATRNFNFKAETL